MAKTTNTFLKSKLNKDLDARIIPNGEYRDAKNVQVSKSEGPNVGSLENVLGNELVFNFESVTGNDGLTCIGHVVDDTSDTVYLFLTDYSDPNPTQPTYSPSAENFILQYDAFNNITSILVQGAFLNFSTTNFIYGVNLLENLLFWTDNRNQPRKINIDLANPRSLSSPNYYTTEDQISIAKYNPYPSIDLWQEVSPSTSPETYETTMQDVTSKYYPNGGLATADGFQLGVSSQNLTAYSLVGDIITGGATGEVYPTGSTVGYITDAGGDITIIPGATVDTAVYDDLTGIWEVTLTGGDWPEIPAGKQYQYVFNPNQYYDSGFAGDPDYLEDKFVRFSYRFKFDDNEYSLIAPFTQVAFIPKQDGYFMYVKKDNITEVDDQQATYRSTIVSFMENKVDQIKLRIPLPFSGNTLNNSLKVIEMDILYKESDALSIKVIDTISVDDISTSAGGDSVYDYTYVSTKPFKTLPSDENIRVYDKVPVKALAQEISGNRVMYANFQNKHTPPTNINYNVTVNVKKDFDLKGGTAEATAPIGVVTAGSTITIGGVTGTIQIGSVVTTSTVGANIPADTFVTGGNFSTTLTLSNDVDLVNPTDLIFTAEATDSQTVTKIEYPNSSVKQNRTYQVGVVLADRYGRQSSVILSSNKSSTSTGGDTFIGDTVYSSYLSEAVAQESWPGDSLKVLFNEAITSTASTATGTPGLYNGDSTSVDYNPLGWYSYKIVVKQTEQEYYNVYLPGIMAAYPEDITLELGRTSHAVLINDNINKIPRDLTEVGPEQKQFRSSIKLYGRVNNLNFTQAFTGRRLDNPGTTNDQYYPEITADVVSTVSTEYDLFGFNPTVPPRPDYYPQFYLYESNPLIARISTQKQIGQIASTNYDIASALVYEDTVDPPTDPTDVLLKNTVGTSDWGAFPPTGWIVTGGGLPADTTVNTYLAGPPEQIALTGGNTYTLLENDILYFWKAFSSPVELYPPGLQYLAIYETEPTESLLDIYWETSTSGLIEDLNNLVLNTTNAGGDFNNWNASSLAEDLASGGAIVTTFKIVDNFGNIIVPGPGVTVDLTLDNVLNGYATNVQASTPYFVLSGDNTAGYNVNTTAAYYDAVYYSADGNLRNFTFNFTATVDVGDGPVSTSISKIATVDNVDVTIPSAVDKDGVAILSGAVLYQNRYTVDIATLDAVNGAANSALAWKDTQWSIQSVYNTNDLTTNIISEAYFAITQAVEPPVPGVPVKQRCTLTNARPGDMDAAVYKITLEANDPASSETFDLFVDMTITPTTVTAWTYREDCGGGDGYDDWLIVELHITTSTIAAQNGYYIWVGTFQNLSNEMGSGTNPITINIDYTNRLTTAPNGNCASVLGKYYFSSTSSLDARNLFVTDCPVCSGTWFSSETQATGGHNFEIT